MNVNQMIGELRAEREAIVAAISVLENMARGRGRRRGRPPAWLAGIKSLQKSVNGQPKRVVSPATKKKMAAAQRKRWAAQREKQ